MYICVLPYKCLDVVIPSQLNMKNKIKSAIEEIDKEK